MQQCTATEPRPHERCPIVPYKMKERVLQLSLITMWLQKYQSARFGHAPAVLIAFKNTAAHTIEKKETSSVGTLARDSC